MIAYADRDRIFGCAQVNLNLLGVRGILDGIVEQVGEDLSESVSFPPGGALLP